MACRDPEIAEEKRQLIMRETGNIALEIVPVNLASLSSTASFANELLQRGEVITLLMNNAGTMETRRCITEDGLERTVSVNYVAPYLLTRKLLPLMGEGSRIVNMVSCTYAIGKLDFPDFFLRGKKGAFKKQETGKHLLWSAGVVLGICILCMMYDINKGMSYYTEHTQANYFCRYILWYICIAPCLLEPSMTKHNSTLYLLLPASAFEKFLHLWMKYILILPIFCMILILGMKGVLTLSGTGYLSHFGNHMELYIIQKDQILTYSLLQGTFFIGCIAFKQQKLINSFVVLCSCLIAFFGIILSISLWEPADNNHGYWIANISYPIYNFPMSSTGEAIIAFCNYATPPLFIIGTWVSVYFLLKEKQL